MKSMTTQSMVRPNRHSAPLHVPLPPRRLTFGNESMSYLLDVLVPDHRRRFIRMDPARADHLLQSIYRYDEVADDVTRAIRQRRGPLREQFEQAVEHGIESVEDPAPEIVAFFDTVPDEFPDIDMELVEEGARAMRRIDPITGFGAGWTVGFFVAALAANTADALVMRKRTINDPGLRLTETANYTRHVYAKGGMERFGTGAKIAIRLRLVHSGIRVSALDAGRWDVHGNGMPASAGDTAGGANPESWWLMRVAQAAGYRFSEREQRAVIELNRIALLRQGVPPDLVPCTGDDIDFYTYFSMRSLNAFATEESTRQLIPPMTNVHLPWAPPVVRGVVKDVLNAYGRWLLGDPICDEFGIPRTGFQYTIPVFNAFLRIEDALRRRVSPIEWLHTAASNWLWDHFLDRALATDSANVLHEIANAKAT